MYIYLNFKKLRADSKQGGGGVVPMFISVPALEEFRLVRWGRHGKS